MIDHARTYGGQVDLATSMEMGSSGDGTNPERPFAASYAACCH